MDINFDRKIISNTNRQYLVQDFLEARVSFQIKITLQFYEVKTIFAGLPLSSYWSLSFFLSNSSALRLVDINYNNDLI